MKTTEEDKRELVSLVEKRTGTYECVEEEILVDGVPYPSTPGKDRSHPVRMELEVYAAEAVVEGDLGVVYSMQRWTMIDSHGERKSSVMRTTDRFERKNGAWEPIQESKPFSLGEDPNQIVS